MNLHTAGGRAGRLLLAGRLPRYSWRCRSILASSLWPCFNRKQKVLWQQEGTTSASTNSAMPVAPARAPSATSARCLCHCPVLGPSGPPPSMTTHTGKAAPCCPVCDTGVVVLRLGRSVDLPSVHLLQAVLFCRGLQSCPSISRRSSSSLRGCRLVGRDVCVVVVQYQYHLKGSKRSGSSCGVQCWRSVFWSGEE